MSNKTKPTPAPPKWGSKTGAQLAQALTQPKPIAQKNFAPARTAAAAAAPTSSAASATTNTAAPALATAAAASAPVTTAPAPAAAPQVAATAAPASAAGGEKLQEKTPASAPAATNTATPPPATSPAPDSEAATPSAAASPANGDTTPSAAATPGPDDDGNGAATPAPAEDGDGDEGDEKANGGDDSAASGSAAGATAAAGGAGSAAAAAGGAGSADGRNPLQYEWTMWYEVSKKGKANAKNYGAGLERKKIMDFNTVEDFWCLWNNILKPSELQSKRANNDKTDYLLFKSGVKPEWEDNKNGGHWQLALGRNPQDVDEQWELSALGLIGDQYDASDEVLGCALRLRPKGSRLELWTRDCRSTNNEDIGRQFKTIVQFESGITYHSFAAMKNGETKPQLHA